MLLLVAFSTLSGFAAGAGDGTRPGSYGRMVPLNLVVKSAVKGPLVLTVQPAGVSPAVGDGFPMSRIHFAKISGAGVGDRVWVSALDGAVIEELDANEVARGGGVWTMELRGTGFKVHVVKSAKSRLEFVIDKILLPAFNREPESIIVKDDNQPIYALPPDSPVRELSLSVVRISISPPGAGAALRCTGFLIGLDEVLTNSHCIDTSELCRASVVAFGVADTGPGSPSEPVEQIRCSAIVGWPDQLDFTVIRLARKPQRDWGRLVLSTQTPCVNDAPAGCTQFGKLALIHQYNGEGKQVSMVTCEIATISTSDRAALGSQRFGHSCNTSRMSSGSPIIDLKSKTVIGLHYAGAEQDVCTDCFNQATMASAILQRFAIWPPNARPN